MPANRRRRGPRSRGRWPARARCECRSARTSGHRPGPRARAGEDAPLRARTPRPARGSSAPPSWRSRGWRRGSAIGLPRVRPCRTPERISTVSVSIFIRPPRPWPSCRRAMSRSSASRSSSRPAGMPSTIATRPGPCDSPAVVKRKPLIAAKAIRRGRGPRGRGGRATARAAARIVASGGSRPLHTASDSAPWRTRTSIPSTVSAPAAAAASSRRGRPLAVDHVDDDLAGVEIGPAQRQLRERVLAPHPHRGRVDDQVVVGGGGIDDGPCHRAPRRGSRSATRSGSRHRPWLPRGPAPRPRPAPRRPAPRTRARRPPGGSGSAARRPAASVLSARDLALGEAQGVGGADLARGLREQVGDQERRPLVRDGDVGTDEAFAGEASRTSVLEAVRGGVDRLVCPLPPEAELGQRGRSASRGSASAPPGVRARRAAHRPLSRA